MMASIRARLLAWVLVLFTVIWFLVTAVTYIESRHEVEELFDSALAQSAAVLSQISAQSDAGDAVKRDTLEKEVYGHPYEKKIAFQIWDQDGLVLRSVNAPQQPIARTSGYSDEKDTDGELWRIFSLSVPAQGRRIVVGERYDVRNELIREITLSSLYPLTLGLPAAALLIGFGLGRGLAPVRRIAAAVASRSRDNLGPFKTGGGLPDEIKPLIDALNNLFERLQTAFERERRFTSDAAHELRTPLAGLKVQVEVARRAVDRAQRDHALEQVLLAVDRMTHLIEQLLEMARLEPEAAREELSAVNLQDAAANALADLAGQALKKNITISLTEGPACMVKGYGAALGVLIRNLVDNAIRYTPDGGTVEVAVAKQAEWVKLAVVDTGPGIPEQERARVFSRFYRGTHPQQPFGSGLGLSIVQRIVDLHGGEITLSSRPEGTGLKVSVTLPSA
jgi:two-component system sensor histidine kinase QseC